MESLIPKRERDERRQIREGDELVRAHGSGSSELERETAERKGGIWIRTRRR